MKVWLDDVRPMPAGYDVHVRTAEEAIDLLRSGRVVAISLDHDLAPEHYANLEGQGHEGTGYDVACFIEAGAIEGSLPPMAVRIHSMNPAGAARMRQALDRAELAWATRVT